MKQTWITVVKARMKELGISQEKLGELIGKTQGAVAHWLNGRREPRLNDIAEMMRVLQIDRVNLLSDGCITISKDFSEYRSSPEEGLVPVRGDAVMKADGEFEMTGKASGWLLIASSDIDAFSVRIKGDSLYPRINSGEFIVIEPRAFVSPGDDVFIKTRNGSNLIKRLGYHRAGTWQFISVNQLQPPLTIDDTEVHSVSFISAIVNLSRFIVSTSDLHKPA